MLQNKWFYPLLFCLQRKMGLLLFTVNFPILTVFVLHIQKGGVEGREREKQIHYSVFGSVLMGGERKKRMSIGKTDCCMKTRILDQNALNRFQGA